MTNIPDIPDVTSDSSASSASSDPLPARIAAFEAAAGNAAASIWIARGITVKGRRVHDSAVANPLAGKLFAVKDNIDVAGYPTTAACPSFAFEPTRSASVVQR